MQQSDSLVPVWLNCPEIVEKCEKTVLKSGRNPWSSIVASVTEKGYETISSALINELGYRPVASAWASRMVTGSVAAIASKEDDNKNSDWVKNESLREYLPYPTIGPSPEFAFAVNVVLRLPMDQLKQTNQVVDISLNDLESLLTPYSHPDLPFVLLRVTLSEARLVNVSSSLSFILSLNDTTLNLGGALGCSGAEQTAAFRLYSPSSECHDKLVWQLPIETARDESFWDWSPVQFSKALARLSAVVINPSSNLGALEVAGSPSQLLLEDPVKWFAVRDSKRFSVLEGRNVFVNLDQDDKNRLQARLRELQKRVQPRKYFLSPSDKLRLRWCPVDASSSISAVVPKLEAFVAVQLKLWLVPNAAVPFHFAASTDSSV
jgi:hypothetical protein